MWSFGQVRAAMLRPGICLVGFQQGGQTRATCCAQQCCDLLRSIVAIVWPELANAGPTMFRYVVLKCCDRLAGVLYLTLRVRNLTRIDL